MKQSGSQRRTHGGVERGSLFVGALVLSVAAAAGSVACGDDGGGSSLLRTPRSGGPASDGTATPQGSGDGTDPNGGPIVGPDGGPLTEAGVLLGRAEAMFRALEPALVAGCGGTGGICHVTGAYQNNQTPNWLAGPDAYASIKAYPGIVVRDPYGSKLIIKGPHAGPAFTGNNKDLGDKVLTWLTEEAAAIHATPLPATDPFTVASGANSVDISKGGTGVSGAKITFNAAINGSILTLTKLQLVAPATTGLHLAHPIFVMVPATGDAVEDPVDSFSNLDQTQGAGASQTLGVGTLILTGWDASAKLQIAFTTLATATGAGDAGAPTGGCKSVASFTANAVPAIQQNACLNCHNTGGSGNASLDLSKVGTDNAAACGQALTKVSTANKAQSDIILAPTGQVPAHPFKNAGANYTTMMLNWINNE
jgi:hypothetical protein